MRRWLFEIEERVRSLFNPGERELDVPPLEGPFRPNQGLAALPVLARAPELDNVTAVPGGVHYTAGAELHRLADGDDEVIRTFDAPVTALAALPDGGLAVAVEEHGLWFVGGALDGRTLATAARRDLRCVTDLAVLGDELVITIGARGRPTSEWKHDLLSKGRSGAVLRVDPRTGRGEVLADRQPWPAGVCVDGDGRPLVSLAWTHRVVAVAPNGELEPRLTELPGYPCRIRHGRGGYWLALFAVRTKLTELVLQENAYRRRMMAEIDPRYWIGPALASLDDHWEPLQGGGIKQLGVVKPWAPPRSYGLVVRLDDSLTPTASLHSRPGEDRHGVTAVAEADSRLLVASRGGGVLLEHTLTGEAA